MQHGRGSEGGDLDVQATVAGAAGVVERDEEGGRTKVQ